jgi:hypothetical protein
MQFSKLKKKFLISTISFPRIMLFILSGFFYISHN